MQVKELGHLVLYVRDLKRSAGLLPRRAGMAAARADRGTGFPAAAFSAPRTAPTTNCS